MLLAIHETAIEVQQVTKHYAGFSLGPLSFKMQQGEIIGLVGENGAGKTTLLSILLNRRLQDSGNVFLFDMSTERALDGVGFVLDSPDFHGNFSPVEVSKYLQRIYTQWDEKVFYETLDYLNVDKNKKIEDMSRGTKSKAMLSIALAHNPKMLILDEVTSGLDPSVRHQILEVLKDRAERHRTAILFSTHLPNDIEKIADSVLFLHKGKMLLNISIEETRELYSKYRSENLEDLMLAIIKKGEL